MLGYRNQFVRFEHAGCEIVMQLKLHAVGWAILDAPSYASRFSAPLSKPRLLDELAVHSRVSCRLPFLRTRSLLVQTAVG